jgi:hypothetical protein
MEETTNTVLEVQDSTVGQESNITVEESNGTSN